MVLSRVMPRIGSIFRTGGFLKSSIYQPLEELIHQRIQEKDGVYNDGVARVDVMQHAVKLVEKILGGITGTVWCGGQAGSVKFSPSIYRSSH